MTQMLIKTIKTPCWHIRSCQSSHVLATDAACMQASRLHLHPWRTTHGGNVPSRKNRKNRFIPMVSLLRMFFSVSGVFPFVTMKPVQGDDVDGGCRVSLLTDGNRRTWHRRNRRCLHRHKRGFSGFCSERIFGICEKLENST